MAAKDRIIEVIYRLKDLFSRDVSKITTSFERVKESSDKSTAALNTNNEKSRRSFLSLATSIRAAFAGLGAREFFRIVTGAETVQRGLEQVSGSSEQTASDLKFLREEAARLGLQFQPTARSFLQLSAAAKGTALEGQATRDIFSAVSEAMARLGRSTDDTNGALKAIEQIISKGTVSSEELRGQLGERLPGAFQRAAAAIGVTTAELGEFLKAGAITADQFIPAFAAEISKLGESGEEINTLTASWNRFVNVLQASITQINDATGASSGLGRVLGAVGTLVSSISVGVTTLTQSFIALGRNIGAFVAFLTQDFSITGYRRFLQDVVENNKAAELAITDAAEAIFSQDENLRIVSESLESTAEKTKDLADATEESTSEFKKNIQALEDAKNEARNLENAQKNLDTAIKKTSNAFNASARALKTARDESKETREEFDKLLEDITGPVERDVGVLDVFDAISRAQEALRDGDAERSLEILRTAGDDLRTLKEEGEVSQISLEDLARSLQRLSEDAITLGEQDELLELEESKKNLDELLAKKQELVEGPIQLTTNIDRTELDQLTASAQEGIVIPVRFELIGGVPAITDGTDVTSREATKRGFRP